MSQFDLIKDIAKYGLANDQEKLLSVLNELVEYSKGTKKTNFALQLQSILKDSIRHQQNNGLRKVDSPAHFLSIEEREMNELILEKLTSDYRFENLICGEEVKKELQYFIQEHRMLDVLRRYKLPVSNKVLLHGPSGCGKTLASYVIAGELNKMMVVINLGAIVSSKLGETSKNLAKIFRKAASEDCIIFIDEFDSIGKVRDYDQDHGEMKRVVNTILQLFDYLPQSSVVIAATNQVDMIDEALIRRFDINLKFELPTKNQIKELIKLILKDGKIKFDNERNIESVLSQSVGLSYYTIQKTLISAIKRSLFDRDQDSIPSLVTTIDTGIWKKLILEDKKKFGIK